MLVNGSDGHRHRINEYAILVIFPGTGPAGMCEVFLGVVYVACGDAHEIATQLECVLLSWILDRDRWAKRVVTFAVGGLLTLVCGVPVRGKLLMSLSLRAMCLP